MADNKDLYEKGLVLRREVLGTDYVDSSIAKAKNDPFLMTLQDCVTEYGWGAIWNRPGLDRKARSMITVGMLIALGRDEELALHIRGAFNNGVTEDELQEIMVHAGCYCGWPASVSAFRVATKIRSERTSKKA